MDFSGAIPEEKEWSDNNNTSSGKIPNSGNTSQLLDTSILYLPQPAYKKSTSLVVQSKFQFGQGISPKKYVGS